MSKGKYEKTRRRRNKKPVILILSLMLMLIGVVGGTVAYLLATTDGVNNTFTPAEVKLNPTEVKTPTSKSNIQFQNTGNVLAYIRATLVINWTNSDGNIVPQPTGGNVELGVVQTGWTEENGFYYYASPVAPDGWTGIMLSEITVTCPDGYNCHIDVHSEAIQAEGLGATSAQDAWKKAKGERG